MAIVRLGDVPTQQKAGSVRAVEFSLTPEPDQGWIDYLHRRLVEANDRPPGVQPPNAQRDPGRLHLVFDPTLTTIDSVRSWLSATIDEANRLYG